MTFQLGKKHFQFSLLIIFTLVLLMGCQSKNALPSETTPLTSEASDEKDATQSNEVTQANESTTAESPITEITARITSDDIIYFIMVDRFADSNPESNLPDVNKEDMRAFQGGDLQGVIDHLDYIKSLGATAIWLTPVMTNGPNGYHGYWIYDFESVDPHFGDMATLQTLVNQAHEMDIKVILDYVVNHTGYNSPWLSDPDKADWFHPDTPLNNFKDTNELETGWLAGLPDLDQSNPEVKDYFIKNALWWIDQTGIDGFRLDTMRHVSHEFWQDFSGAIKEKYPDFFLLGEVWDGNTNTLESYHEDGIDSLTNYSLYNGIINAFNVKPNILSLANALEKEKNFSTPTENALFIDNHDNARFMSQNPKNKVEYTKLALAFTYTYPAIPVLYYGTEIAMDGAYDPVNRTFMDFNKTEVNDETNLIPYLQFLAQVKEDYSDRFRLIYRDKSTMVYEISKENKRLMVALNASESEQTITFDYTEAVSLTELTSNEGITLQTGSNTLTLPPLMSQFYLISK